SIRVLCCLLHGTAACELSALSLHDALGATPIVRLVRTLAHCLTPGAFRKYNDDEPADRAGGPCVPAAVAGTLSWNIARSGRSAVNRVVRVTGWCPVSGHQRTDGYRRKHKEDTG